MDQIKLSLKYIVASIITTTNLNPELSNDEKEAVINSSFNGLVNSLIPEYAIYVVDVILGYSDTYKQLELENLMDNIGWSKDINN